MTKIYLVEVSWKSSVFHRKAFTNKKKAIAYKNYYELKSEMEKLEETYKIYEVAISKIDYTEDFEKLQMEQIPF